MEKLDKLIKLLNEYDSGWAYDDYYGPFQYGQDSDAYHLCKYQLVSKEYGFIKWLIDNDRIDFSRGGKYSEKSIEEFDGLLRDDIDGLIMVLAIQDKPIEFLIEILK